MSKELLDMSRTIMRNDVVISCFDSFFSNESWQKFVESFCIVLYLTLIFLKYNLKIRHFPSTCRSHPLCSGCVNWVGRVTLYRHKKNPDYVILRLVSLRHRALGWRTDNDLTILFLSSFSWFFFLIFVLYFFVSHLFFSCFNVTYDQHFFFLFPPFL